MVEWFPVPPERKAKIESQIKSGLNRVFREIQREEEEASGRAVGALDEDEEEDDA
jgi:cyclase